MKEHLEMEASTYTEIMDLVFSSTINNIDESWNGQLTKANKLIRIYFSENVVEVADYRRSRIDRTTRNIDGGRGSTNQATGKRRNTGKRSLMHGSIMIWLFCFNSAASISFVPITIPRSFHRQSSIAKNFETGWSGCPSHKTNQFNQFFPC